MTKKPMAVAVELMTKEALKLILPSPIIELLAGHLKSARGANELEHRGSQARSMFRRIDRLENKTNPNNLDEIILKWIRVSEGTFNHQKMNAATEAVVGYLRNDSDEQHISFGQAELLLNAINSLPVQAMEVLAAAGSFERTGVTVSRGSSLALDFKPLQRKTGLDENILFALVSQLSQYNLIHLPNRPTVREGLYDNYRLELTHLGKQLITMLSEQIDA